MFLVAFIVSMAGLAYAMRDLSVGTAYAVWVGIGQFSPWSTRWPPGMSRRRFSRWRSWQ
ncbi:small Multidrug Resistance family protein [Mycobacterium ulcerans str. Harvey]|uniref:Small Multidrug Resistance family protein n=1 Tax=Mycobacterium ulcerans str. Harvey TaxID=1299332 RepID=A0ABN0QWD6_MYCUL|nr:small Multidrug Resistance family protein [Mycobacterium ulcerans str. Harvey]